MSGMTTISDVRERLGTCSEAVELICVNPAKQKHGENMRENPANKGWCLIAEKVEIPVAKIKNIQRKHSGISPADKEQEVPLEICHLKLLIHRIYQSQVTGVGVKTM